MRIDSVGVVGAGTMGSGIAQVFSQAGYEVILVERSREILHQAESRIRKSLARFQKKGVLSKEDVDAAAGRIAYTTEIDDGREARLIVEAVFEDLALKKQIFRELDEIAVGEAILATNTSSISITEIAAATRRAPRVIGMHFMNPVPIMKLVEIVRGLQTSDDTYMTIRDLTHELGKTPVLVNDYPGFVSNRILMPMINEAVFCLMEGVATREAIDKVMKLGMNHPMGPLALADLIGLDICLNIMEVLHREFGDSKYRPCPLLRKMVAAGFLGRKAQRGFYNYVEK
jgi:3-hydroxybutyryl-CoA dehydrogenase